MIWFFFFLTLLKIVSSLKSFRLLWFNLKGETEEPNLVILDLIHLGDGIERGYYFFPSRNTSLKFAQEDLFIGKTALVFLSKVFSWRIHMW